MRLVIIAMFALVIVGCVDPIGRGSPFDEHLGEGVIEEPYSKHNAEVLGLPWPKQKKGTDNETNISE